MAFSQNDSRRLRIWPFSQIIFTCQTMKNKQGLSMINLSFKSNNRMALRKTKRWALCPDNNAGSSLSVMPVVLEGDKCHKFKKTCSLRGLRLSFVCLVGFLTSSSTTRTYRGRAPRQFYVLPLMRQSWETMTSVSACHIILTPTQPVGSGRPQRESNPGPHQESRAIPTELHCNSSVELEIR